MDEWALFNDFALHAGLDRHTKLLARYELFRRVVELPGDVVECGVCRGAGLLFWAKLLEIFAPRSDRRVVGFDLFGAEPKRTHEWDEPFMPEVARTVSVESLLEIARAQGLEKRVEIVPGDASRTVGEYAAARPGWRISLLNLDFDNYDPTRAALAAFFPRVVAGGVVAFDDYGAPQWGESDAVDEFLRGSGYVPRALPWALSPRAYVVKGEAAWPSAPAASVPPAAPQGS